jgi:Tfp pilus assembly protein PilF
LALAPGNPSILYHLGAAKLRAGDREGAKVSLEKAMQISRSFKESGQAEKLLKGL